MTRTMMIKPTWDLIGKTLSGLFVLALIAGFFMYMDDQRAARAQQDFNLVNRARNLIVNANRHPDSATRVQNAAEFNAWYDSLRQKAQ